MIENGIQVYFVDEVTLKTIRKADDYGYKILTELISENEKREQNVRLLKDLDL
jgi:hypothetical protein